MKKCVKYFKISYSKYKVGDFLWFIYVHIHNVFIYDKLWNGRGKGLVERHCNSKGILVGKR